MIAGEDATPPRLDELVGTREACERYGLFAHDISNAAAAGELTKVRLPGRRNAWYIREIEAFAARRRNSGAT